jgi:hypothetical protein
MGLQFLSAAESQRIREARVGLWMCKTLGDACMGLAVLLWDQSYEVRACQVVEHNAHNDHMGLTRLYPPAHTCMHACMHAGCSDRCGYKKAVREL